MKERLLDEMSKYLTISAHRLGNTPISILKRSLVSVNNSSKLLNDFHMILGTKTDMSWTQSQTTRGASLGRLRLETGQTSPRLESFMPLGSWLNPPS